MPSESLRSRLRAAIAAVEQADRLDEIPHLRHLRGVGNYYRIRVGDYRAGLSISGDTVIFVRFLHRRDIYRHFP